MQANMEFMQKAHLQGLPPPEMEQTAPVLKHKKRSYVMKTKYAYSIKTSRVKEPDFPYEGQSVTCTSELVQFARSLQDADIEKVLTLYLNAQNKIICIQITNGTVNQANVYPREILRHALLAGACAIILIHNHPSNEVKPSDSDIRLTKTIQEITKNLDILVHDHIIIGGTRFFSFREEGLM